LYLSQSMLQKANPKKIQQSLVFSAQSVPPPVFITQERPETPAEDTLPVINHRRLFTREIRTSSEHRAIRKGQSNANSTDYLSILRKRDVHSQVIISMVFALAFPKSGVFVDVIISD